MSHNVDKPDNQFSERLIFAAIAAMLVSDLVLGPFLFPDKHMTTLKLTVGALAYPIVFWIVMKLTSKNPEQSDSTRH